MYTSHRKIVFVLAVILALSSVAEIFAQRIVTAAQVNGTWRLKNSAQENEFKIWALGNNRLKVQFEGYYYYLTPQRERMANMGEAAGMADIEGDTAIFKPDDTDDCTITMKFTRGLLIVTEEGSSCGFGHNVTSAGTYRKVSARKPKFN